MRIEKVKVTPEMASKMLAFNGNNRPVKNPVVLRYASDIAAGQWKEDTAEMIKVSRKGRILDGQHRLMAVVKANRSASFHVAYDVEDNVFDVLDTGCKRSAHDVFAIAQISYSSLVPALIQLYNALNSDLTTKTGQQVDSRLTNAELLAIYNGNEDYYLEVAKMAQKNYLAFSKVLPPQAVGGFYLYFNSKANGLFDTAKDFIEMLCTGENVKFECIANLRKILINDRISVKKMTRDHRYAYIIKAWNIYRTGDKNKRLTYNPTKEKYPVAI